VHIVTRIRIGRPGFDTLQKHTFSVFRSMQVDPGAPLISYLIITGSHFPRAWNSDRNGDQSSCAGPRFRMRGVLPTYLQRPLCQGV
jgi:hypothetical protein